MLDKNGKALKVGDTVLVRGKVVHISEQKSGRNMNVETLEDLPGAENPSTKSQFAIASSQSELDEGSSPANPLPAGAVVDRAAAAQAEEQGSTTADDDAATEAGDDAAKEADDDAAKEADGDDDKAGAAKNAGGHGHKGKGHSKRAGH